MKIEIFKNFTYKPISKHFYINVIMYHDFMSLKLP